MYIKEGRGIFDFLYKKIGILIWGCIVCLIAGTSFVNGPVIEVQAAANGTADGTYDFGGTLGANNSAGPGFATFSDKFVVSNDFQVDGTKLKPIKPWTGSLIIKAEGNTTKVFDLRSLGVSTDEVGGATLKYIEIKLFNAKNDWVLITTFPNKLLSNNIEQIQSIGITWDNISRIEINWEFDGHLDPAKLNFDNITVANVKSQVPPFIQGVSLVSVTPTDATVQAAVKFEGDAPVTERGFVYSKNPNPTLNDSKVIVVGTTGPFQATLSGLSPNTGYYYRAYATSSVGTVYKGESWSYFMTQPLYTITYSGNGQTAGVVPMDNQEYEPGEIVSVSGNIGNLVKTGYTFIGWNTKVDGSGTRYAENATFKMGSSNIILYAQWDINSYTLTFDSDGGSPISPQTIQYNKTSTEPTPLTTKAGFTFGGWYKEAALTNQWDFTTDVVTANTTLYAKWIVEHELSFESNGGSSVAKLLVADNTIVTKPTDPTKAGYTFGGWYKEAALTNQWDFTTDVVTANTTLYAKWNRNSSSGGGGYNPVPVSYTLSFETNGGSAVVNQNVVDQTNANEPTAPTKAGYTFSGWYKDAALTMEWDFTKDVVTTHTTLYAKWIENSPEPEEPKPSITFTDITSHWAKGMIEDIAKRGIITGFEDGSFRPNDPIQRQHIAVMFNRAFDLPLNRESVPFSDVSPSHRYYEAITKLQQAGIVDGSDGEFNPSATITRAQLAKIIVLGFGLTPGGTSAFPDVPTTHWSYDYIAALADKGIALGDNGNFRPGEPVTRAQFVAFMYRAFNL